MLPITGTLSSTQFQLSIPGGELDSDLLLVAVPLTSRKTAHIDAMDHRIGQRTYTIDLTCSDC